MITNSVVRRKKEKPEHDGLFWRHIREMLGEMKETRPHGLMRIVEFPSLLDAWKNVSKTRQSRRRQYMEVLGASESKDIFYLVNLSLLH